MIRSFVAAPVPSPLADSIGRFVQGVEKGTRGIRWVRPEGIHITLRFLGGVTEEVLKEVSTRLKQLEREATPIRLAVRGVGFFPNASSPRIAWVGLEGELDRLAALKGRVAEAVRGLDVAPEEGRAFRPHLTIGRIRDPHQVSGLDTVLEEAVGVDFGAFVIDHLVLFKSELTPGGARYTNLATFPLVSKEEDR